MINEPRAQTLNMKPYETDITRRLISAGLRPPRTVTLAITNRCNLRCRHCWPESGAGAAMPEVPAPQAERLIRDFAALGAENSIITGGEPLNHPDWFRILTYACAQSEIREVRLQTNATLITSRHVEAFLSLRHNGLIIQTSLEGAEPRAHDLVRGSGSYDQTLRALKQMIATDLARHLCITFTEMQHNIDQLPALLEMVDHMGIRQFIAGSLVQGGRARTTEGLSAPTPEQYERLLIQYQQDEVFRDCYHRIANIAALEWAGATTEIAEPCCTLIETPYVTAGGQLHPCVMLHTDTYAVSGIYNRPLAAAIAESIASWSQLQKISHARRIQLTPCNNCACYTKCGAGCMGRAYAAYGTFFAAEDRCSLRKAVYLRHPAPQ